MLSSLFSIFSRKEPSLYESVITNIYEDFSSVCKGKMPELESIIKDIADKTKKEMHNNLDNNLSKENLEKFVQNCFRILSENGINNEKIEELRDTNMDKIGMLYSELDIQNYNAKLALARKYCKIVSKTKKCIKAVVLGDTQQGKTLFIKKLFQISDDELDTKNNTGSDTEDVKEHTYDKNGIVFTFVDCPGFHDSRGKEYEKRNRKKIMDYLQNNRDIDLIFWISKLDRILDGAHIKAINSISEKFGDNVWSKCIIALTCANSSPIPESLYPDEFFEEEDENAKNNIKKQVWQKYVNSKKAMWKGYFDKHCNVKIPICLVENNRAYVKTINGISVLENGEPFWENLMYKIFKMVDAKKAPVAFMAMAKASQPKKMDSHDKNLNRATEGYLKHFGRHSCSSIDTSGDRSNDISQSISESASNHSSTDSSNDNTSKSTPKTDSKDDSSGGICNFIKKNCIIV